MSNKNQFPSDGGVPDDEREEPFSRLEKEQATADEYRRSHERLQLFASLKVEDIETLADLSRLTSDVGNAVRQVILSQGKVEETRFSYLKPGEDKETPAINRTRIIREGVAGDEVAALTRPENIFITNYRLEDGLQLSNFDVSLRADQELRDSGTEWPESTQNYAVDWRSGRPQSYYPNSAPYDASTQQGFARVLQDGVKNILSVIPLPLSLPEAFNY